MKKLFAEFKAFISKGNVIDLAVGMIIGSAFTAIVTAVVNGILTPLINWIPGADGTGALQVVLREAVTDETGGHFPAHRAHTVYYSQSRIVGTEASGKDARRAQKSARGQAACRGQAAPARRAARSRARRGQAHDGRTARTDTRSARGAKREKGRLKLSCYRINEKRTALPCAFALYIFCVLYNAFYPSPYIRRFNPRFFTQFFQNFSKNFYKCLCILHYIFYDSRKPA